MENVVITGAAGGLGRCLARRYVKKGCRVFGCDLAWRDAEKYVAAKNGNFEFDVVDVGDDASVASYLEKLSARIQKIQLLINCAGVLPDNSARVLEEFEIGKALEVYSVNALGPLRMVKAALPLLRRADGAVIVNISSEAGSLQAHADYTYRYDYCMSKAALNIQSIILQRYLKKENIRVLAIHPGWMKTAMGGEEAPVLPEESAEGICELVNLHRYDYHNMVFMDYNGKKRAW